MTIYINNFYGKLIQLVLIIIILFSANTFSADYPLFRGNNKRTGYTNYDITLPLELKWKIQLSAAIISSPIKVANKIIFGCRDKNIYAYDAFTGEFIWKYTTSGWVDSSPAYYNNRIYVGSWDGNLYCINVDNGSLIWKYPTGGMIISSPIIYNNKVIVGVGDNIKKIIAVDANTSELIWSKEVEQPSYSSAAIYQDTGIIGVNTGYFYLLDLNTGEVKNKFNTKGEVLLFTPAVSSDKTFAIASDYTKKFYALNITTLQKLWEITLAENDDLIKASSPAVAEGIVYITAGYPQQKLFAIDEQTGSMKWSQPLDNYSEWHNLSSPLIANNVLYVGSAGGYLYIIDKNSGNILDKINLQSAIISSPALSPGMLYIATTDGTLYAYSSTDTQSPIADITSPKPSQKVGKNVQIIGTAYDTHFKKFVLSYGEGNTPDTWTNITTSYYEVATDNILINWDTSSLQSQKEYTLNLEVFDIADNKSEKKVNVIVDNIPPQLIVDTPQDNLMTNQKEITISGKTETSATIKITNGEMVYTPEIDNKYGSFATTITLYEGENVIIIEANDDVGNSTIIKRIVTYDTVSPILNITSPTDGLITNQKQIRIVGEVKPNIASDEIITQKRTMEETQPLITLTLNGNKINYDEKEGYFATDYTLAQEGENILTFEAATIAANKTTKVIKVILDTIPPTGSIVINDGKGYTNNKIVNLKLIADDKNGTGVTQMIISNMEGFDTEWIDYATNHNWQLIDEEGKRTVYVKYKDKAKNESEIYSATIILDKTPPCAIEGKKVIVINNDEESNYTNKKEIELTFNITDNYGVEKVFIKNDDENYKEYEYEDNIKIQWQINNNDKTIIYVKFKDYAGNYSNEFTESIIFDEIYHKQEIEVTSGGVIDNDIVRIEIPKDTIEGEDDNKITIIIKSKGLSITPPIPTPNEDGLRKISKILEIIITGGKIKDGRTINLTFYYDNKDLPPGTIEQNLRVFRYNENTKKWEIVSQPERITDKSKQGLKCRLSKLSLFAIFEVIPPKEFLSFAINYPNPFNPKIEDTNICFKVNKPCYIRIGIYNLAGEVVKKIEKYIENPTPQGEFEKIKWSGRNTHGNIVANGIYIYRIIAQVNNEKEIIKGKIVVLK